MRVVDLLSSDEPRSPAAAQAEEVIEILSSPSAHPSTPLRAQAQRVAASDEPALLITSSPLFDFEKRSAVVGAQEHSPHEPRHKSEASLPPQPASPPRPYSPREEIFLLSSPLEPSPKRQRLDAVHSPPLFVMSQEDTLSQASAHVFSSSGSVSAPSTVFKDTSPAEATSSAAPTDSNEGASTAVGASNGIQERINGKKAPRAKKAATTPTFASAEPAPAVAAPKARKSRSIPAAATRKPSTGPALTDRRRSCESLVCTVWNDTGGWDEKLQSAFSELEVPIRTAVRATAALSVSGVAALVTVHGEFDDAWDDEQAVFMKTERHVEHMPACLVVLRAAHLDVLGAMDGDAQAAFFAEICRGAQSCLPSGTQPEMLYFVPGVAAHFRKVLDRYNRTMRQRLREHSQGLVVESAEPPNELFYTDLESELQIAHDIRAVYPRKDADAAELMANCVVDLGYTRYRTKLDELDTGTGGSVRSRATTAEITVESLTKVPGLPPRIATAISSELRTMGKLKTSLGVNEAMRASRLKRFGRGMWNTALLELLTSTDPNQVI